MRRPPPRLSAPSRAGPRPGGDPIGEDRRRRGGWAGPIRVLIADDEPDARAALRALLEEEEPDLAVVGEAGDGVEAICATQRLRPHVLLLDLALPEIAGAPAAKVLRRTVPETRIVVLTGTGPARAPELLRLDVHGYLCKPVEGPELADALRAVHGGGVCLAPDAARRLAASDAPAASPEPTPREQEILHLIAEGHSTQAIAAQLRVSERTVEGSIAGLCAKLGAASRPELVHRAHQRGWLT